MRQFIINILNIKLFIYLFRVSSKLCINECDNIKPIIKSNILKEISDKEKKRNYLNCQSKIPINSNAKLSFLSSLSCKYI